MMKRGSNELGNKKIDTLIGKESNVNGTLESSGTIRVDGKFEGDIITKSDLVVGENGEVEGKVRSEERRVGKECRPRPQEHHQDTIAVTNKRAVPAEAT